MHLNGANRCALAGLLHYSNAECSLFEHFTGKFPRRVYNPDNPLREIPDLMIPSLRVFPASEKVMFAYILDKISNYFESAERSRREAYLASSADVADLEKRMRALENNGYTR